MQKVVSILSNAGGVAKTTLATHLSYSLVQNSCSVALIDLDPQHSLDLFCGLDPVEESGSITSVLAKKFDGNWPLVNIWDLDKLQVCQGHQGMEEMCESLVTRTRGEYVLADRLQKYPLPHDLVILDCPTMLSKIITNALAASTHIVIPLQPEPKAISGSAELIQWCINESFDLELNPRPSFLGLVPTLYDKTAAAHVSVLKQLPEVARQLEIKLYPPVRRSKEFVNSSTVGLPLHLYRPSHPATSDFNELVADIKNLMEE